jgi:predicted pyridoxine 5'-phosphate oxidase superfamily flavin-nucleotide-binding protein
VQYRGGPLRFLRVLDDHTLGFADFRGNRQYVTTGNVTANDRISLYLMDYAHQRRLKIFGRLRMIAASANPELVATLAVPDYAARSQRAALIQVEAFDWNCPQHITPRFTHEELDEALTSVREEIECLRTENQRLRHRLGQEAGSAGQD